MDDHDEREPLLSGATSPTPSYSSISKSSIAEELGPDLKHSRSVENHVLPETSVIGRNLGWGGAFILVISRVIGSGIFATPGAIVRETGSIGLALCLWIAGALIAWAGLAISLEYGCMLPRSGGAKIRMCPLLIISDQIALQARRFTWNSHIVGLNSLHQQSSRSTRSYLVSRQATA